MFLIPAPRLPESVGELRSLLEAGLERHVELPPGRRAVQVEGRSLGSIDRLLVELSGGRMTGPFRRPRVDGEALGRELEVGELRVRADPARMDEANLHARLEARRVRLGFGRTPEGELWLVPRHAEGGELEGEMEHADLERLLVARAGEEAARRGIAIEETALALEARGERGVGVRLRVQARKILPVVVHVQGRLEVTEDLMLVLSGLRATGEGIAGALAQELLRPHLERQEGRRIPLLPFPTGGLKLRDLRIETGRGLAVRAAVGGGPAAAAPGGRAGYPSPRREP